MAHFDDLETQDPALREQRLFDELPVQVRHAQSHAPAFAERLAGIEPQAVTSREALARLPVTRKSELLELQQASRPFGGFMAGALSDKARVFQSPGPLYEPEGRRPDYWRFARALYAAGFRSGDLIHNTFSYHFTPAGFMVEGAAAVLECPVFPAGVGQTEQQVQAIADLRPAGYVGTPSFLKIIVEKALDTGADISSLTKALVSGEALPPSLRAWFAERGIDVYQCYATADLGLIAYESEAREGLIVDEGALVEIVRPGSGEPVADGEVGEVVVTTFNLDYPLIRFGTGDLSAILPGASPCGRTNCRIKGWMGRADQTTKVKGMFVHPGQINDVARRHAQVKRARLVVEQQDHNDIMVLHCETDQGDESLKEAIAATLREMTKLRGRVLFVEPGSLPNDGKVIDDQRRYD